MTQMTRASGVQFITGTIAPDAAGQVTVNFGKNLTDYIVLIEMTDASITTLESAGVKQNKAYFTMVKRLIKQVDGYSAGNNALAARYNGSGINSNATNVVTCGDDNFKISAADISNNAANSLYVGYTYSYTVIPLD